VFVYNHIELESIASMSADYYLPSSQGDLDYESNRNSHGWYKYRGSVGRREVWGKRLVRLKRRAGTVGDTAV
jgi:hypothetical protein